MFRSPHVFANRIHSGIAVAAMTLVLAGCESFNPPTGLLNPQVPANLQYTIDHHWDFDVTSLDVSSLRKSAEPVESADAFVGCWGWSFEATINEFAELGEINGSSFNYIHFSADGHFNSAMYTNTSFFSLGYVIAYEGTYRYVSPGVVELTATKYESTDQLTGELIEEFPLEEPLVYESDFRIVGDQLVQASTDADENGVDRASGDGAWAFFKFDCVD